MTAYTGAVLVWAFFFFSSFSCHFVNFLYELWISYFHNFLISDRIRYDQIGLDTIRYEEANHCIPPTYITFASISNLMKPKDYCFKLNRYLWFYKVFSLLKIRSSRPIIRKISLKHLLMCKSILVHLAWFIHSLSHLLRVAKYTYWVAFFFEDSYVLTRHNWKE